MRTRAFLRLVFLLAAVYNVAWGLYAIYDPQFLFRSLALQPARYEFLMAGIGLFVALYGYGYFVVSLDLQAYPQLVVIGLAGKVLGPIGWAWNVHTGALPLASMYVNLTNDIVWVPFFVYYLFWYHAQQARHAGDNPSAYLALPETVKESWPAALLNFHRARVASASGEMRVRRGRTHIQRFVAVLSGLPEDARRTPVRIRVFADRFGEIWLREFGTRTLRSRQWREGDYLAERFGPIECVFRLEATQHGYQFVQTHARFLGLRLPAFLSPTVRARVRGTPNGWWVRVRVRNPVLGLLVSYGGRLVVEK
ncbi:MAG: DUF4166 domain-containing protein [Spirochaetales bacterium]|nr:DUF4166 domain-containing protein [Leptospiraceae bacterium]MCP5481383.1 DUF4166 domain-containing protein [Spirochaetales bacterium]MCP5486071.1 DUF4166 domain-containing protein [Spirochaetales bacterium]